MKSRLSTLLAAGAACTLAGSLALFGVASPASAAPAPGEPGQNNAITDVPGLLVGQVQSTQAPYLTGTTVVYAPKTAVAGADIRGGAPGTRETDLLSPLNSNPGVNAVMLTGGSAYGLDAASGIMSWLEDRGEGVRVGSGPNQVVPIVPGAVIFDLNRGGGFKARPTADWGYQAISAATSGPVRQGTVGGGTGARAGGIKGGVGTASITLDNGIVVAALVIVNAAGSTVNPIDCSLLGASLAVGNEFAGLETPKKNECHPQGNQGQNLNTTIAVVATNATLEKAAAAKMAGVAHDGMARAINPVHTLSDGDSIFALSTGTGPKLAVNDPASTRQLNQVFNAAANTLSRAIVHAMISATSTPTIKSYCDTYPSACKKLNRQQVGSAPDVQVASTVVGAPEDPTTPATSDDAVAVNPLTLGREGQPYWALAVFGILAVISAFVVNRRKLHRP